MNIDKRIHSRVSNRADASRKNEEIINSRDVVMIRAEREEKHGRM